MKKSNLKLCIDLGSTCFKAAIFDESLRQIGEDAYYLSYLSRNIKVELAVKEVDTAFAAIIKGATEKAGIKADQIAKIGITSQAQTFVLCENGKPVNQFITWEDCRGTVLNEGLFADFSQHCSFYGMSMLQLAQLVRLKDDGTINPKTEVLSLPSYLIKKLCGESVTDCNLAAMSGLYSLANNDWHQDYLKRCGLNKSQISRIIPLGSVAGKIDTNPLGLKAGIPVYCCGNDQTAGAAGAKLNKNDMLMTLGTAQVLYQLSETMPKPQAKMVRGPYLGTKFYRLMCASGGSLISKIIQMNVGIKDYDDFFEKASSGQALAGFKVEGKGEIQFASHISPQDIAFSTLQYICRLMKGMYEKFVEINGKPERLLVAGGGSRNEIWLGLLEKELGNKLLKVDANPLLGAARMIKEG